MATTEDLHGTEHTPEIVGYASNTSGAQTVRCLCLYAIVAVILEVVTLR